MQYRRYTPAAPLSTFVGCIWYSEGMQGSHARERLLPNGESCIVFDLREKPRRIFDANDPCEHETYEPAVFCGARADSFVIETSQQERVVGIQFRPGGAFPFLSMPADEVAHSSFALDHAWPGHGAEIREQLMSAKSVDAMFLVLETALLSRLARFSSGARGAGHPAVHFAIGGFGGRRSSSVSEVADRVGLSSRRFIELFRRQTGLTPKVYQRVRRFQQVLHALRGSSDRQWTDLALRCGYYDQAHFIHDFREYSGLTPGEYVLRATPHVNHLPIDA